MIAICPWIFFSRPPPQALRDAPCRRSKQKRSQARGITVVKLERNLQKQSNSKPPTFLSQEERVTKHLERLRGTQHTFWPRWRRSQLSPSFRLLRLVWERESGYEDSPPLRLGWCVISFTLANLVSDQFPCSRLKHASFWTKKYGISCWLI